MNSENTNAGRVVIQYVSITLTELFWVLLLEKTTYRIKYLGSDFQIALLFAFALMFCICLKLASASKQ